MNNKIECTRETLNLATSRDKEINCCSVNRQIIDRKDIRLINFNKAATAIKFNDCALFTIPSAESIKKCLPNLTFLFIKNSKLSKITSEDLEGFDCLTDLYVTSCEIEYLPGDLFKHTPKLEVVSFHNNMIKYIDEGILDPLQNLKFFNLSLNVSINTHYDILNRTGISLKQLKKEIKMKCCRIDLKKAKKTDSKRNNKTHKEEIADLKEVCDKQQKEITDLKGKYDDLNGKFEAFSQQFRPIKQDSKNFTIKVHEKQFRVNKAVLIAHSEVLAKLIADNPEADDLELKDLSEATFQEILNFMNDGSAPAEDADLVELFGASFRLKIEALTTIVAELLKEKVNHANAFNVLTMCEKFDKLKRYDELKKKALAEYSKV